MQRTREQRQKAPSDDGVRERLRTLLDTGRTRAQRAGHPVLVSTTERAPGLRAMDVLDPASTSQMYWAAPRDKFALAGLGAAATLSARGDARFAEIAVAWQQLLDDAVLDVAQPRAESGPLLMGGFAFDPEGPRSPAWRDFGAASFTVPRLSVACRSNECWLTLNAVVDADTDTERLTAELTAARDAALTSPRPELVPRSAPPSTPPSTPPSATADNRWRDLVRDAVRLIDSGGLEKVVLAREVTAPLPADFDILSALRHLDAAHTGTFIYGVWRGDAVFFGATPERLVRLQGRDVSTSVLAGSWPRGADAEEDARNGAALLASEKDLAEHEIVRRDMEAALMPVCDAVVTDLNPSLVSLAHVHHLHTSVRARLEDGRSVFDVVERLHPTPAVGGAPKQAALAFIREREEMDRGWYAAPIGWVGTTGAEFAVALRCSLVRQRQAALFAGCGIVAQSDPDTEYEESQAKLRAAREALVAGSPTMAHQ